MKPSPLKRMPLPDSEEGKQLLMRAMKRYHEVVRKSDGFDVCGLQTPTRFAGLDENICNDRFPCPGLVRLYARLGLHRYNVIQGKNLELSRVKKYNRSTHTLPGSYYITMEANDPDSDSLLTFQACVSESIYNRLLLSCRIARPLGESDMGEIKGCQTFSSGDGSFRITNLVPELPTENPFKRFYLLKKSEVQDNDWIRLYLELAVATTNRRSRDYYDLYNLKIVKVAIETRQDLEPLSANDATLYIRYKDSYEGKDVDNIAIVRRILLGCTYIVGWIQSSETIIPKERRKSKRAQLLFRRLLSPWRLFRHRGRKAYKNRRLHKTRFISDNNNKPSSTID